MEIMPKVWSVVAGIWVAVLAAIVYFEEITASIWLLLAWWVIPQVFIGTFVSWAICEKKGWV